MFKLCAKLFLLATLATLTVQVDKCPTLVDKDVAQNFKFSDHKGTYYATEGTANPNGKELTCISFNIKPKEGTDKVVETIYQAYNKGDNDHITKDGIITWTNNQAIGEWQDNDDNSTRNTYILDYDDNVILWYSCHEVKENDTAPVTSIEQYAGIMAKNLTEAGSRTQELVDKLYNLVQVNVTSVDTDTCSGSAQTVLSLSLGVIALLYCLISTGTTV